MVVVASGAVVEVVVVQFRDCGGGCLVIWKRKMVAGLWL